MATKFPTQQQTLTSETVDAGDYIPVSDNSVGSGEFKRITMSDIRDYVLNGSGTPVDPEPGNPLVNTPKGHWVNMNLNDTDAELEVLATQPIEGVIRNYYWSQLETAASTEGNPLFDLSEVKASVALAASLGTKHMVALKWRSFNSDQPAPDWMVSGGYVEANTGGGQTIHMHEVNIKNHYLKLVDEVKAQLDGVPGFAGIATQECALGYAVTELNTAQHATYVANLTELVTYISTSFPSYYHFWFANHLNSGVGVQTGRIYDIVSDLDTAGVTNIILSGPDIFPSSDSLEQTDASSYIADRIYTVVKRVQGDYPDFPIANSMQFDSYQIDPSLTTEKWGGCWDLPNGNAAEFWPMRDLFIYFVEQIKGEWCLWNRKYWGDQRYNPDALAVFAEFPTWEKRTNLIPAYARKYPASTYWTNTDDGLSFAEDVGNFDGENSKRAGLSSYRWTESASNEHHRIEHTFVNGTFSPGEVWTLEAAVEQLGGLDRDFRLEVRKCDGSTDGARWDFSAETFVNKDALAYKWIKQAPGIYLIQIDFVPCASAADVDDCVIKFKVTDNAGNSNTFGSGTEVMRVGRLQLFKSIG